MWLALLGCCCCEESGRWQEWRREQNVINQQQKYQRSKGLKAAVKITCCLTQGHNSPNRICSCFQSCSQSGRAAGSRNGLNWTAILRKTLVHMSPPVTTTQPMPKSTAPHHAVKSVKWWSSASPTSAQRSVGNKTGEGYQQKPLHFFSLPRHNGNSSFPNPSDKSATEASNT